MKRAARSAATRIVERDHYVPYLLGRISKSVSSSASMLYRRRLGMGINDARLLLVLARRPRITGKELSEDTALNKSVISRSLRVLRAKALVRIVPRNRRLEVELTGAGREMEARVSRIALEREGKLLFGFSNQERRRLLKYLHRLLRNVPRAAACDPLGRRARRRGRA